MLRKYLLCIVLKTGYGVAARKSFENKKEGDYYRKFHCHYNFNYITVGSSCNCN